MFPSAKLCYENLSNSSKFSVYHVKLTDSALKALEELQGKNSKASLKIRFDGSEGFLQIPVKQLHSNELVKSYSFTLTPEGKDGSTECFGQPNRSNLYNNVGIFSQKLTIKASDDVFQNTLEKMSKVELESKKNCVKEIKFKDHEKKLTHFKSKHSVSNVTFEPKKVPIVPKPRKAESNFKPHQTSIDPLDFTSRVNNRLAPTIRKTFNEISHQNSPAVSLPDVSNNLPVVVDPPEVLPCSVETQLVVRKTRIAHQTMSSNNSKKNDAETLENGTEEFESLFPSITSKEERENFKSEFNKEYETYLNIYNKMSQRMGKINRLVQNLRQEVYKSELYKKVLFDVYNEHSTLTKNQLYNQEQKRCTQLHKKLSHIKKKINEFDNQVGNECLKLQ